MYLYYFVESYGVTFTTAAESIDKALEQVALHITNGEEWYEGYKEEGLEFIRRCAKNPVTPKLAGGSEARVVVYPINEVIQSELS